jgi:hypothetical protein
MEFREIVDGNWQQVLELNEASLSKLDCRRLEWIVSMADLGIVVTTQAASTVCGK